MRPKYRVWDKQKNEYFKPTHEAYKGNLEELTLSTSGELMMRTMTGYSHESTFKDRFIVELFTGRFDKNGKKIFDGDRMLNNKNVIHIVIWDNLKSLFCVKLKNIYTNNDQTPYFYKSMPYAVDRCVVIGNIHQPTTDELVVMDDSEGGGGNNEHFCKNCDKTTAFNYVSHNKLADYRSNIVGTIKDFIK